MGTFTQRPSAYTPPLDGSEPNATLVSGGSDSAPAPDSDKWRIELRRHPILHRGHAILALVSPDGKTVDELNGMAQSRNTNEIVPMGVDGMRLVVTEKPQFPEAQPIGVLATGSYDDI